jgi:hypothetical protein
MTVARGFAIIIASGFGFAVAGGLLGSTLARVMPGCRLGRGARDGPGMPSQDGR